MAAEPCSQFIQLQVWEVQMAEKTLVEGVRMFPSASQPAADGSLSGAEDPFGSRRVQPFGQSRQDHGDLVRGSFQAVQGGVASSTEHGAAGLTTEGLDPLSMAMLAISYESVDGSIGDPAVRALRDGTSCKF